VPRNKFNKLVTFVGGKKMLKCKCCKQSKFGAILEEIKTTPITMANGEPVKVMEDKAQLETKVTITYYSMYIIESQLHITI
jgi:hypothetical protein